MDASKVFELARTAEERPTITVGENGPHVGILGTIVGKPESGSDTGLEPGESDDEDAGKMKVLGSLDRDIIKRVIRSHLSEIKYCYERELRKDPKLRGSVDVRFTIGPTGSVSASMTPRNTTGSEALESCLAKAVKRWKFPKPTGGGIVVVTYPFVFKPA
jgi:TonB family protein